MGTPGPFNLELLLSLGQFSLYFFCSFTLALIFGFGAGQRLLCGGLLFGELVQG